MYFSWSDKNKMIMKMMKESCLDKLGATKIDLN
jgi:hypothetical protein